MKKWALATIAVFALGVAGAFTLTTPPASANVGSFTGSCTSVIWHGSLFPNHTGNHVTLTATVNGHVYTDTLAFDGPNADLTLTFPSTDVANTTVVASASWTAATANGVSGHTGPATFVFDCSKPCVPVTVTVTVTTVQTQTVTVPPVTTTVKADPQTRTVTNTQTVTVTTPAVTVTVAGPTRTVTKVKVRVVHAKARIVYRTVKQKQVCPPPPTPKQKCAKLNAAVAKHGNHHDTYVWRDGKCVVEGTG